MIMEDETCINPIAETPEEEPDDSCNSTEIHHDDSPKEVAYTVGPLILPPAIGGHVTVNFDTGFKIGEVIQLNEKDTNKVRVSFMHLNTVSTIKNPHPRRFWIWGYSHSRWVKGDYIPPGHPVLELSIPPSTEKCLCFCFENLDKIEKFANM